MDCDVSIYLDKRRLLKDNRYPIRIRVYGNGTTRFISTEYYATAQEFDRLPKKIADDLNDLASQVRSICRSLDCLDVKLIRSRITGPSASDTHRLADNNDTPPMADVLAWFSQMIKTLNEEERFGSRQSYEGSVTFYKNATDLDSIPFTYFTPTILKKIQNTSIKQGLSISTVGRHARNLRAIFNLAINSKGSGVTRDVYPFGRNKYIIPQVTKSKKSLSRQTLKKLINFQSGIILQERAVAYFIFSFFGNGMNMKDIAMLRYCNLTNNILGFYREKTINTSQELKLIRVVVTTEMKKVIDRFGVPGGPDDYIFPILRKSMTTLQMFYRIREFTKDINLGLRQVVKAIVINDRITFGMARHTFGNALKQEGVSVDKISEMLGHSSTAVTEHYLSSLEDKSLLTIPVKLRGFYESDE